MREARRIGALAEVIVKDKANFPREQMSASSVMAWAYANMSASRAVKKQTQTNFS